MLFGQGLACFT